MKIVVLLSCCLILIVTLHSACKHKAVIPDSPTIKFSQDVQPIIISNCTMSGCHEASSRKSLADYSGVMNYVSAGDAYKSPLYKSIISLGGIGTKPMPPSQPLSEDQLKIIYVWIMQGAKQN